MPELQAYGVHLPGFFLSTTKFGDAGAADAGRARSVANHDEDAVTLGVAAAQALGSDASGPLWFATSEPPYLDKSSAATVHAALDLPAGVAAIDLVGLRSGGSALVAASRGGGTAVAADLRTPTPGSPDELAHGDGAVAFAFGEDGGVAEVLGAASVTDELLDRWRLPGEAHPTVWDERFTQEVYLALIGEAARGALAGAGLDRADRVVVSCANARAAAAARKGLGGDGGDAELEARTGHTGAAHVGLLLADALDRSAPEETILVVAAADGADALVLRAGADVAAGNRGRRVREQLDRRTSVPYDRYLRRRRLLDLRGARRPDPQSPAAPPMHRRADWKYALVAAKCGACGAVFTPPGAVCPECGAVHRSEPYSLRDRPATVVSYTVDHLAPSPDPPVVLAVVDVDGGGRRSVEVTDVPAQGIAVGDRLTATFRRVHSAGGIHNYFWKARPEEG